MRSITRFLAGTILIFVWLVHAGMASAMCTPTPTTVCLVSQLISVTVDWTSTTASGAGAAFPVATDTTGFFTLDDPGTVEVMAKAVDACSLNGNYWVFLSILSEHELSVHVTDHQTGNSMTYNFAGGSVPQPIADTAALSCTPPPSEANTGELVADARAAMELALVGGRFRVSVQWETSGGASRGHGQSIPLTDSSGTFWYFSADNPERLLSIEPNASGDAYRLVSNAASSVGQTITIRDTCHGTTAVHDLLPGVTLAIVDDDVHPIACTAHLFANDFETGNVSFWSSSTH